MTIRNRVRRIYERRPYPAADFRDARWMLAPLEWIAAVGGRSLSGAGRVLVAGCGAGNEAFAIAQKIPTAEVVAVDFSPRSIAAAERLQKRIDGGNRIRFELADLESDRLKTITGGSFDMISCHGMLSYAPDPSAILRNLKRCLAPGGLVVLGVNGAAHPSPRFRRAMAELDIDPEEFSESRRLRDALGMLDSLSRYPVLALRDQTQEYLASDLFGPLNRALPLSEWCDYASRAGLHLRASYDTFFALRSILNKGQQALLLPRSRAAVSLLVDIIRPASFHHLVLSPDASEEPPWKRQQSLVRWRPVRTPLFEFRWPGRGRSRRTLRDLSLESVATNTRVDLRVPFWEVEVLRECDGSRTLGEILQSCKLDVQPKELREQLYVLYQLGAINLLPPGSGRSAG
ncbi:MAG: class I SAM-dependent methyltransferase [Acidobacteriota bacterium]